MLAEKECQSSKNEVVFIVFSKKIVEFNGKCVPLHRVS